MKASHEQGVFPMAYEIFTYLYRADIECKNEFAFQQTKQRYQPPAMVQAAVLVHVWGRDLFLHEVCHLRDQI